MKSKKLCECGCGSFTNILSFSKIKLGLVKGQPRRFLSGHNVRLKNPNSIENHINYFWERVDKINGPILKGLNTRCWMWIGSRTTRGYGRMPFANRKMCKAHRIAWFLAHGKWPSNLACHHCDNPSCIRPEHLFNGATIDNSADMVAKGRCNRGEGLWCAKLNDVQVTEIRKKHAEGKASYKELAVEYGVSRSAISQVLSRHTWRHIG